MRSRMAIKDGYNKKYRNKDEALRIHSKSKFKSLELLVRSYRRLILTY